MGTTTECIESIIASGKSSLEREQIQNAVEQVDDLRRKLIREGKTDNLPGRLREAVSEQAQRLEIIATAKKRNTYLNVLAHQSALGHIDRLMAQGLTARNALLALMEGTQQGVVGGRVSVNATKQAYAGRYVGDMLAEVQREVPHANQLIEDRVFNEDVTREMWELREGGTPGSTGNADARTVAGIFAKYAEMSRVEVNQRGGLTGKLDGWAGAQIHDDFKLLAAGEEKWIDFILPLLDHERTFAGDRDVLALTRQEIAGLGGENFDLNLAKKRQRQATRALESLDRRQAAINRVSEAYNREQAAHMERIGTHREGFLKASTDSAVSRHKGGINESAVALTRLRNRVERLRRASDRIAGLRESAVTNQEKFSRLSELLTLEKDLHAGTSNPREFLREAYTTMVTGTDGAVREMKGPARPGNLAKSMARSRVLHFKDAEAALAYNREFGHGAAIPAMIRHQERMADLAAQMEMFGPNPDMVVRKIQDDLKLQIRNDPYMTAAEKKDQTDALNDGAISDAFAEMSGVTLRPVNMRMGVIFSTIRSIQSMAKLGQALISSIFPDLVSSGMAAKFRGGSAFSQMGKQIGMVMEGRPKGEQAEIAYHLNEAYQGVIGEISNRFHAEDGMPGATSRLTHTFFKWSGLTWWTEVNRAAVARGIASELAEQAGKSFETMNPKFRHALSLHNIDAAKWEAIRQGGFRVTDGGAYLTPDRMRSLPDSAIDHLIADHIAALPEGVKNDPDRLFEAVDKARDKARFDLEMALRRFVSDETGYAILEPDAATRRYTLHGSQPGTWTGEFWRTATQFKSFPVAFANRVIGRGLYGHAGATKGERMMNGSAHMGELIALSAVAGYATMTMKDIISGYGPREINMKTVLASLVQGGGLGIWGDFLFGEVNRFGNGPLETALGPVVSSTADLIGLFQKARDGDTKAGEVLNFTLSNTPFLNLWYLRPALDILVLNSLREAASPGTLASRSKARQKDFGQERILPMRAF